MKNKLFLTSLAAAVLAPSVVASVPVFTEEVETVKVGKSFSDVPNTFWAYNEIMSIAGEGGCGRTITVSEKSLKQ